MIAKLRRFFEAHTQAVPEDRRINLKLAAASMLLEVVFADDTLTAEEEALLPGYDRNTINARN